MIKEQLLSSIKDELFSQKFCCYVCLNEKLDDKYGYLCEDCYSKLDYITRACEKCGDKVNNFDRFCNNCKENHKVFDYVVCFAKLNDITKRLVYRLKYGKEIYVAQAIAHYLVKRYNQVFVDKVDYVVYVPITRNKLKERGFCHTEEIAKIFAKQVRLEIYDNLIIRVKDNLEQTKLNREMRKKNLLNAFVIQDNVDLTGKNILIIDDVYTTGATMDAISQLLRDKGASKVFGLTFCHS